MDDTPASISQPQAFSSDYTRRLVQEAEESLGDAIDPAKLDEEFARLAQCVDELDELEFKRLLDLTKLLAGDPESLSKLEALKRDGTFEIKASDDRMSLVVSILPSIASGRPVAEKDILQWITNHHAKCEVEQAAVRGAVSVASTGELIRDVIIARGRLPEAGEDEKLRLFARSSLDSPLQLVELSDGRTEDGAPLLCAAGDLILKRISAKPGQAGHDVFGNVLQAPAPRACEIGTGRNVRVEGNEHFAEVSGVISFAHDHIEVRHMLVLAEDVTRQNGPIDFDGQVVVRGAVRNGAEIKATGDITVDGPVEAATIESTAGSIELRHGVAGHHRGVIRAELDVNTRFAENVTIYAGRDITINLGSLHSHLLAGRSIHLVRGRGQLIGGSASAGELVEAKQLGSISAVPTEVILGLSRAVMQKLGPIDSETSSVRLARDQVTELADRIERAIGDPTKLTVEELKIYTALRQRQFVADQELKGLDQQRRQVLEEVTKNHTGRVDVLNELLSQVTIRVGQAILTTSDTRKHCRVAYDVETGRLLVQPLR